MYQERKGEKGRRGEREGERKGGWEGGRKRERTYIHEQHEWKFVQPPYRSRLVELFITVRAVIDTSFVPLRPL